MTPSLIRFGFDLGAVSVTSSASLASMDSPFDASASSSLLLVCLVAITAAAAAAPAKTGRITDLALATIPLGADIV